ncbi:sigma factor-like helix-turn-helix DNA-binding protein [Bacilliculturomica massiliensis]|uniref:sigma factor-like helix-turn-helix DNA-binding protein n=1 Tax=Bacilliculturomica massiliensis TaxID=1917867 RepID=UPI001031871E|nr:sigma factor-like helix-turn-helix DNA-binding protein [Bacilliculturomica massiliensis]
MDRERKLLELYLKQTEEPELEEFLDFVYRVLFSAYVKKTAVETKKAYCMRERLNRERLCYLEDPEIGRTAAAGVERDETEEALGRLTLRQALSHLPEKQAEVLVELFLKARKEEEVALERGISRQAVNGLKRRGLEALRREMKG